MPPDTAHGATRAAAGVDVRSFHQIAAQSDVLGVGFIERGCGSFGGTRGLTAVGADAAAVFGEAVGGAAAEGEGNPVFDAVGGKERELADEIFAVFEIDFQILRAEQALSEADDLEQLGGVDSVIGIVGDPELELATLGGASGASTVDEVFGHETHLRDVEVGGDESTVRKLDRDCGFWVFEQELFEFGENHGWDGVGCFG